MLLKDIYTNITTMLSSDGNDGVITLDRFNTILPIIQDELIRAKIEEQYRVSPLGELPSEAIYSSKIIRNLIVAQSVTRSTDYFTFPLTTGSGYTLTYALLYFLGASTSTAYNGMIREIKLISDKKLRKLMGNLLEPNISENPVVLLRSGLLHVYPSDITAISISYVRRPVAPFLDYYINASKERVFMTAATEYAIGSTSIYRDGSTGTKQSATKELEVPEDFHPEFQDKLLERLSLVLNDQFGVQYAMSKQAKEDQE
jgi:hypothetical protein